VNLTSSVLVELNSRYLRMTPGAMAEWLVNDLERAGAAGRRDGLLVAKWSEPGRPWRSS